MMVRFTPYLLYACICKSNLFPLKFTDVTVLFTRTSQSVVEPAHFMEVVVEKIGVNEVDVYFNTSTIDGSASSKYPTHSYNRYQF